LHQTPGNKNGISLFLQHQQIRLQAIIFKTSFKGASPSGYIQCRFSSDFNQTNYRLGSLSRSRRAKVPLSGGWLALPVRDSHPLEYPTLPSRPIEFQRMRIQNRRLATPSDAKLKRYVSTHPVSEDLINSFCKQHPLSPLKKLLCCSLPKTLFDLKCKRTVFSYQLIS